MSDLGEYSDESDKGDIQDDVVETKGPSRYDEKEDKKKAEKRGLIVEQTNTLFDAILHHPQLWQRPEMQKIREFVEIVSQKGLQNMCIADLFGMTMMLETSFQLSW